MTEFLNSWLGVLIAVFTLLGLIAAAFGTGWRLGRAAALRSEKRSILKERLDKVYAPLRARLLDCHITTVTTRGRRPWRKRIQRSLHWLSRRRVRRALRELTDRGDDTLMGVDYGRFPMSEIREIASANAHIADPKLLELVQAADRAGWETAGPAPDPSDLTEEDLALAHHIWDHYRWLSRKLSG